MRSANCTRAVAGILVTVPFGHKTDWRFGTEPERYRSFRAERFVAAVEAEVRRRAVAFQDQTFATVYFGGCEPSLLSLEQLYRIIQALYDNLTIQPEEQTLVVSPGTMNEGKVKVLRESGFDRMELRLHDGVLAEADFRLLRAAGFPTVGVELAYDPDPVVWERKLDRLLKLGPDHVALHFPAQSQRTRPRTQRSTNPVALLDSFRRTRDRLAPVLNNYALHHYAQPGHECRHLLSYWSGAPAVGFGPGAVSQREKTTWSNPQRLADYLAQIASGQEPSGQTGLVRSLCNELIRLEGIAVRQVPHAPRRQLVGNGLLTQQGPRLFLTDQGVLALDRIAQTLAAASAPHNGSHPAASV